MTIDRRVLASALATLLLVAACGGSASPAPTAEPGTTQAPAATEAPTATAAAETPATAAPEPTSGVEASFVAGAAGDLEALLPADVNGVSFTRTSFDGNSIPAGTPIGDSEMEKFLKDNGKGLQDVRVAIASPSGSSAATAGNLVMAIQIKGVDSGKLLSWATGQFGDSSETKQSVGGKDVYGSTQAGIGAFYFYVKGDTVFYVASYGTTSLAEAIIQKLP